MPRLFPFGNLLLLLALLSGARPADGQEGFRLLSDRVEIRGAADWEAWEAPHGARVIDADGTVSPRRLRRDVNAALDAGDFQYISEGDTLTGGIFSAGTNAGLAPNVIDGDDATWWEPAPGSAVDNWWIDIDLGRLVVATRIVVRFAEGGDPFLTFRVLTSDGRFTLTEARQREFYRVGLANLPNKSQREFVFDVEPRQVVADGIEGDVAQIVRIQALDSDGARGAVVDSNAWAALDSLDRGAIDHFRRTSAGRQIRVEADIYAALPADERGDVRYYRQERPRLAEVEIYSLGDNAARLTMPPLGTRLTVEQQAVRPFVDGLFTTYGFLREYDPIRDEHQVVFDLGARYWLDRLRLLSPSDPPLTFQVRLSDGSLNPDGNLVWRILDERVNREEYVQLEESFPAQQVRYIDVRRLQLVPGVVEVGQIVGEFQALGEGYVSSMTMTSPLMELGRSRLFTGVEWEGEEPLGTRIEVRTRTGDDILRIPHYFTPAGTEISQVTWERRDPDRRGPIVIENLPGDDWSDWSEVYRESGDLFRSPAPRTNALVEVRLVSQEPQRAARLTSLALRFAPPLVDRAFAELTPIRVEPGQDVEFTLFLQPRFGSGNPGFDRVRLRSASSASMELLSVRSGALRALELGGGRELWPGELTVDDVVDGAVDIGFPTTVRQGGTYAIRFRTQVFLGNTPFQVELHHDDLPSRVQQVSAGDVTSLSGSQSLVAVADLAEGRLLGDIVLSSPVVTPNGDGVHDEVTAEVTVFAVEGRKRLRGEICDLSGRRRRDLSQEVDNPSGRHRLTWDGRDDTGQRLPPGIYLLRVGLRTDAGGHDTDRVRLLHLVY
jgi:hypothetical protein